MNKKNYQDRFSAFSRQALYRSLAENLQTFIRETGFKYSLTFQELRQLTEMAVDFQMWGYTSLPEQWVKMETKTADQELFRGKKILALIRDHWNTLKNQGPDYRQRRPAGPALWHKKRVSDKTGDGSVLGLCPVASENTICCNLRTLDSIQGCGLACSYCSIRTFYDPQQIVVEKNLAAKLRAIKLNPERKYHIGSGQSSDSLLLGNRNGILEAQFEFTRRNPNLILELKTKSKNIGYLLENAVPANVFVTWSLNTPAVIEHEEHLTASLAERLNAARLVADRGIRIGFHLHPIVHYRGWSGEYEKLVESVTVKFSPPEIALVSLGTLTFIKPAIKNLRLRSLPSKVLQMPLVEAAGKLSYPPTVKKELFRTVWKAFQSWHGKVFFYLCMEEREIWNFIFGRAYASNEAFERDLYKRVSAKLNITD